MKRRKSRDIAFQIIYAMELSGENKEAVLKKFASVSKDAEPDVWTYAMQLLDWTIDLTADLNESLKPVLEHWTLERLSKVDKALIYMGCAEIELGETPAAVVIDEIVELAKIYGDPNSPGFVNGIVDAWRKKR